jgi:nucleotide-binding universal stress UspA family protein
MKNILVPCDFSKPAITAFRFALDVAAQSKGKIYLLNVVELPIASTPLVKVAAPFVSNWGDKIVDQLKKLIVKYNTDVNVLPVVEYGTPAQAITAFSKKNKIDIIIMGSHGASGLREFLIGSNAEKVVRHSSVPVLITKQYSKEPIKHIVFPNTLETENQQALTMKVKALQAFFKATVHIVFVNTPRNFTSDSVTLSRLREFAKHFMFKDYTITVHNDISEEEGIMNFARTIKDNLIAMGTNARKGVPHVIQGSVAEDVVNHTDSAIWTYAQRN